MGDTLDYLENSFPDEPEEWGGESNPVVYGSETYIPVSGYTYGFTVPNPFPRREMHGIKPNKKIHIFDGHAEVSLCGLHLNRVSTKRDLPNRADHPDEFLICDTCRQIADR